MEGLTLELAEKEAVDAGAQDGKMRTLEQLRWRLAAASRRVAHDGLGDAA
jgi:hypothetical protein